MHFLPRRLHQIAGFLAAAARRLFRARPADSWRPRAKRPVRCWFERLETREVFNATFQGGALIPHVEAQAVFLGSQWTSNSTLVAESNSIDSYLGYAVQSPYMDMLTDAGYNVGQGTATTGARINVALTATTTDATIRSLLQQAINLKLVQQPDANRLYIVYMPTGITVNNNGATSQVSFLGYHGAFAGTDASKIPFDIHYAVIPHPGAPNPTSASQAFPGISEVQTLTLGGASGGTLTPVLNGVAATTAITRTDEVQTLTLGGTDDGSFKLSLNAVAATIALSFTDMEQELTLGGADGDQAILSFNGVNGSAATALTFQAGVSPTAVDVFNHLSSISALNGNIQVTGNDGGPFTIRFNGSLSGLEQSELAIAAGSNANSVSTTQHASAPTASDVLQSLKTIPALNGNVQVSGGANGSYTITFINGLTGASVSALAITDATTGVAPAVAIKTAAVQPTAALVQASLATIAALGTNVSVTGSAGGPFTVTIKNLGNVATLTTTTTGGMTGAFTPVTDGVSSDFDQLTAVTSHEMAEAVTDPDVNYKTLGWYDLTNNVEIGDLNTTTADVVANDLRLGPAGYYVQDVFNQNHTIISPDTTSISLISTRPDTTTTTALTNVTISQLSPTQVNVSWSKVDAGATGYRIFRVVGSQTSLLARVPGTASSAVISGLPSLTPITLKIEAYNAAHTTDLVTRTITLDVPAVQKPIATAAQQTPTSVKLDWSSPVQLLTLGGDSAGTFLLSYNGHNATSPLARVDEQQRLTLSGPDGGVVQLSLDGVSGSTATQLTIHAGVSPTAAEVQAHLSTIPALSSTGNLQVTGPIGGPFTITFSGGLSGVSVHPLQAATANGATVTIDTITSAAPTAAAVAANLKTIAALNGHVSVTGNTGGPFTIMLTGAPVLPIQIASVTGGVTAAVNPINGAAGFRIFKVSGTSKTIVATLPGSATTATVAGLKANSKVSFIVEAFRGSTKADSSTLSVSLNSLGQSSDLNFMVAPTPGNNFLLTWSTIAGAKGYRVFRMGAGGRRVPVATLGAGATSLAVAGLPAGTKFQVEAFSGASVLDSPWKP